MIELYRPSDCAACAEIEEALKDLVIAHKIIKVTPGQPLDALTPDTPLPAIKENGRIISGQAELTAYLSELEKFVADWQRFQADACYIDDDGETC